LTRNTRRLGRLAGASLAILFALTLAACGSPSSSSHASASSAASPRAAVAKALNQLTACLSAHGIKVPSPLTRRGVRATLKNLPQAKRQSVITACRTEVDALLALRPGH